MKSPVFGLQSLVSHTMLNKLYAWLCQRLYAEFAWGYDLVSWWVSLGGWARWRDLALHYIILEQIPAKQVLEIGFGTGELLIRLRQRGVMVYGLELSPAMHKITAAKLRRQGLQAPRVQGQAQTIPFAAGSFDAIVATFPAPYILELNTLRECVRLLRPPTLDQPIGGRLVIVGLWVELVDPWLQRLIPLFYGKPTEETLLLIRQRVEAAGFQVTLINHAVGWVKVGIVVAERGET